MEEYEPSLDPRLPDLQYEHPCHSRDVPEPSQLQRRSGQAFDDDEHDVGAVPNRTGHVLRDVEHAAPVVDWGTQVVEFVQSGPEQL